MTVVTLLFLTGLFESLPEATLAAVVIAAVIELVDIALAAPALPRVDRAPRHASTGAPRAPTSSPPSPRCSACSSSTRCRGSSSASPSRSSCSSTARRARTSPSSGRGPAVPSSGTTSTATRRTHRRRRRRAARRGRAVLRRRRPRPHGRPQPGGRDGVHAIVLDLETVPFVDVTAAAMLGSLRDELDAPGVELLVARDVGQVRDVLRRDRRGPPRLPDHRRGRRAPTAERRARHLRRRAPPRPAGRPTTRGIPAVGATATRTPEISSALAPASSASETCQANEAEGAPSVISEARRTRACVRGSSPDSSMFWTCRPMISSITSGLFSASCVRNASLRSSSGSLVGRAPPAQRWRQPPDLDELETERVDQVDDAVQRRLIGHGAVEHGLDRLDARPEPLEAREQRQASPARAPDLVLVWPHRDAAHRRRGRVTRAHPGGVIRGHPAGIQGGRARRAPTRSPDARRRIQQPPPTGERGALPIADRDFPGLVTYDAQATPTRRSRRSSRCAAGGRAERADRAARRRRLRRLERVRRAGATCRPPSGWPAAG